MHIKFNSFKKINSFGFAFLFAFWHSRCILCLRAMLNFIKNLSPTELTIIAAILLLPFGSKTVIKIARKAGETVKEFKKIKKSVTEAVDEVKEA